MIFKDKLYAKLIVALVLLSTQIKLLVMTWMAAHWIPRVGAMVIFMLPVHLVEEKILVHVHALLVILELKQVLLMTPISVVIALMLVRKCYSSLKETLQM